MNLGDQFGRATAACAVFCGTPLGCGLFLSFRFRGFGEYASPPAILCAAVGGRCIGAFTFSIQGEHNPTIAALLYRNPSTNGFFLSAGSPCGKRSKPVESDQWITGYSIAGRQRIFYRMRRGRLRIGLIHYNTTTRRNASGALPIASLIALPIMAV